MAEARKAKGAASKKLDPAKATIYVAAITLLGGIIVASISNVDKFRVVTPPNTQGEAIITFQEHKYNEISEALEGRARQAREEEKNLTAPRKGEGTAAVKRYIKANSDTKIAVARKHEEFKAAIRSGDHFKANVIKTEINALLRKERANYVARFQRTSEAVVRMLFSEPDYYKIPQVR